MGTNSTQLTLNGKCFEEGLLLLMPDIEKKINNIDGLTANSLARISFKVFLARLFPQQGISLSDNVGKTSSESNMVLPPKLLERKVTGESEMLRPLSDEHGTKKISLEASERSLGFTYPCSNISKFQFIFPVQFVITVVGNLLTMTVLLSGHIKNRANHLLASLALCDMMVFVMMLPHYVASIDYVSDSPTFRLFHFHSKPHFGALTNWFSAAAIWFVLAVSVERLLIIKFPFRSLDVYNTRQIVIVSVGILLSTLVLTSYHHISHTCLSFIACHGTQVLGRCYPNTEELIGKRRNPTSDFVKQYLHVSVFANALLAVLLPIFAVAILNISLIRLVKKRHSQDLLMRSATPSNMQEQEKKMTHTVLAIVTCFTLTQGPSAVVFIHQNLLPLNEYSIYLSVVANELVLTGKMLNVVLFCLTSETFRRRLWHTCRFWFTIFFYVGRKGGRYGRRFDVVFKFS
ncbi:unnamed protein product [Caenorhabditis auriculariae]|uniref:G-protein coupled receptors family 1 profile domain-containing protein n=1 Tax=Caenorhabditis auriculariae TaxID=2777116 RepID=A0A8S1H9V8_9PELO|nr:unnamed protein product [Caenorhabditis auriculariae]